MGKTAEGSVSDKEDEMEKKELTKWQAIGIGAVIGFVPVFLAISISYIYSMSREDYFKNFDKQLGFNILVSAIGAAFGIAGALIEYKKGTKRAVLKGAAIGVGVLIALYICLVSFFIFTMD